MEDVSLLLLYFVHDSMTLFFCELLMMWCGEVIPSLFSHAIYKSLEFPAQYFENDSNPEAPDDTTRQSHILEIKIEHSRDWNPMQCSVIVLFCMITIQTRRHRCVILYFENDLRREDHGGQARNTTICQ